MGIVGYILLGVIAGIFSGLLGIGGGTVVVPGLVYVFGMTLHKAQGTILAAFLPPVAILAVMEYARQGHVDFRVAAWVALGIFVGSYFGALLSHSMNEPLLKKVFGVFLLFIAAKLISGR